METTRTNYTHRKNSKTNFQLTKTIGDKKREVKFNELKKETTELKIEEEKEA